MIRATPRSIRRAALTTLFIAAAILCGCITERTPAARVPSVGPAPAPSVQQAPAAARASEPAVPPGAVLPVDPARSTTTAAKVAIEPLGLVPYDGMTLPIVSLDGSRLAVQIEPVDTDERSPSVALYDLSRTPPQRLPLQDARPIELAGPATDAGFPVWIRDQSDPSAPRRPATLDASGAIIESVHRAIDPALAAFLRPFADPSIRAQVERSASRAPTALPDDLPALTCFDPRASRMVLLDASGRPELQLMPGSIAASWAIDPVSPALLMTSGSGLHLQRLERTGAGWAAASPVRLLREPYVATATSNPARPFILIGPGPKDRPDQLSLVALRLITQ